MSEAFLMNQSPAPAAKYVYLGEIAANRVSATLITFNLTSYYPDYAKLTAENIVAMFTSISKLTTAYYCNLTYTYNATTGIFTVTSDYALFGTSTNRAKIYVI